MVIANRSNYFLKKIKDQADIKRVVNFMQPIFFYEEPLNKILNVATDKNSNLYLELVINQITRAGVSVQAVDGNDKLLGVMLNSIINKHNKSKLLPDCDTNIYKIIKMFNKMDEEVDLFARYPKEEHIFKLEMGAVLPDYQSKGILTALVNKSLDLGREVGCSIAAGYSTSYYTQKAMAANGFRAIYSLKYDEYKDNGEVVFGEVPAPHSEMLVQVRNINNL